MVPKATRRYEAGNFAPLSANNPALKTVNRVFHKNGTAEHLLRPREIEPLAEAAVQHGEVKQGNYDASLSF
jgi:hypothetical protein